MHSECHNIGRANHHGHTASKYEVVALVLSSALEFIL